VGQAEERLKFLRAFATGVGVIILAVGGVVAAAWLALGPRTVMTRPSPDGRHKAILKRVDGIDVNFQLVVDGEKVYWSPDFAPAEVDFRENLAWDRSGTRVFLSVADHRIFGYDANARRPLEDAELLALELPEFEELGFEGKLPRQLMKPGKATELPR